MNVMETAKIIAANTQLRPCIPLPLTAVSPRDPVSRNPNGVARSATSSWAPHGRAPVVPEHYPSGLRGRRAHGRQHLLRGRRGGADEALGVVRRLEGGHHAVE